MKDTTRFPFYLRRSFYLHCALFSLGLIGGKIVLNQQLKLNNDNLELVRASVRVDMVAMPEHTLEELKTMTVEKTVETPAPAEVQKEEVKPTPPADEVKIPGKDMENRRESFLSKLKQLSNQKLSKKNTNNKSSDQHQLKQLVLAGNKLNKGTATFGDSRGGDQTAFQAYVSQLPQRVKPYWRLPSFLLDKQLTCRVRVWIAMSGEIIRAQIYQSSGDSEYDQKALDAVNSASPFPELSDEFGKRALSGDILLGFPL